MPYTYKNLKGEVYYLNNNGKLYWFSRKKSKNTINDLPEGYKVLENRRTGMPYVKKI